MFGEVGLAGEVRGIAQAPLRVREAAQMGFRRCIMPEANIDPSDRQLAGDCELSVGQRKLYLAELRRSGAHPGDWLLVTGCLGGSILDKHLGFTPRVREAQQLHELAKLHAMIDISDGLASDLGHICDESRCARNAASRGASVSGQDTNRN
jgi:hypothetical protein